MQGEREDRKMTQEISALRSEMNERFRGIEKWLERVTDAIERQSENRERLIALEAKNDVLVKAHDDNVTWLKELQKSHGNLKETVIKLSVYGSIAATIGAAVISLVVKNFFGA